VRSKAGRYVVGMQEVSVPLIKYKCQLCVKSCVTVIIKHFISWVFHVYVAYIFML
jgi:hypothetical protein